MKKAIVTIVALLVVVGAVWWMSGGAATPVRPQEHPWPAKLGALRDVPKRYPRSGQSDAASELLDLADAAQLDLVPLMGEPPAPVAETSPLRVEAREYIRLQLSREGEAIDDVPKTLADYLTKYNAPLDAVRDRLLRGDPVQWPVTLEGAVMTPNLLAIIQLQRALVARSLLKARGGDARAWDELHASWQLAGSLWNRPEPASVLVGLASARMINAAARKLPLPVPPWFREVLDFDPALSLAAAQQAEVWSRSEISDDADAFERIRFATRSFRRARAAEAQRQFLERALDSRACDFASLGLKSDENREAWRRLLRYRAEREATERVLQLRAGQKPSPQSQCSDGSWNVTANGFAFTRDIPVQAPGIAVPLRYSR
ncbi:MAG TPA: hypothetical protein VFN10_11175 [Thermoanaerobaculia bacterium]|nr:hypothetical protein [Thermoanaerobaculia bacterium]